MVKVDGIAGYMQIRTPVRRSLTASAMQGYKRRFLSAGLLLIGLETSLGLAANLQLDALRLPSGFHIEVLTDAVPNARQMTLGRYADGRGVLYVGSMGAGKVYAVELALGRARAVHTIASGLNMPVGVAYQDSQLYVSAVSRILRLDRIDDRLTNPPAQVVVTDRFPTATHHGGSSSRSGRMAGCMCRSARHATSAIPTRALPTSSV